MRDSRPSPHPHSPHSSAPQPSLTPPLRSSRPHCSLTPPHAPPLTPAARTALPSLPPCLALGRHWGSIPSSSSSSTLGGKAPPPAPPIVGHRCTSCGSCTSQAGHLHLHTPPLHRPGNPPRCSSLCQCLPTSPVPPPSPPCLPTTPGASTCTHMCSGTPHPGTQGAKCTAPPPE